ncbi:MAG: DcaP family trimeric outer membrane transporter [Bacteroidales bacterium]
MLKRRFFVSLFFACILGISLSVADDSSVQKSDKNLLSWEYKNTTAKIGGFVLLEMSTDFGGSISSNSFYVSSIPIGEDAITDAAFAIDAAGTRINLDINQSTTLGDVKLYIEGDFAGTSSAFRLRHAYLQFNQFLLGQSWSLMCDAAATFPSADLVGNPAKTHFRAPQVAFVQKFKSGFSLGTALEAASSEIAIDANSSVEQIKRRYPDIPAYIQYAKGDSHIKLAGVFRGLSYYDVLNSQVETRFGWGAQLSGSLKVAPMIELYAQGIYGKGIGKYINDLQSQSVDLMANVAANGDMDLIPMYSASTGANIKLSKSVNFSAGYAYMCVTDVEGYVTDDTYHTGNYTNANIFWKPMKPMTLALEYIYGKRVNMDGENGTANRINVIMKYNF